MALRNFFKKKMEKYPIVLETKEIKLVLDEGYGYLLFPDNKVIYLGIDIQFRKLLSALKNENNELDLQSDKWYCAQCFMDAWGQIFMRKTDGDKLEVLIQDGIKLDYKFNFILTKKEIKKWIKILEKELEK